MAISTDRKPCDLPSEKSTQSFWHSQPSPLLTAHRSTRNLPQEADVVIVGSGITGTSIAHHLLNGPDHPTNGIAHGPGPSVVMLEAREACWGATGRNGGHCQPLLFEHPSDPSIANFELANFYSLQSLIHTQNIDCEFVAQAGVRAFYSQSMANSVELALEQVKSMAPDIGRLMRLVKEPEELAQLRVPTAKMAVATSTAARMWPYKFVTRLLEDLIRSSELKGTFNLQTLTPVDSIEPQSSGDRRWLVKTSRGNISAARLVLATNAYTSHLLPDFADLIVPCRGQMSALHPLTSIADSNRLQSSYCFGSEGVDDYLIQRPNETGGHLMFGGGRQCGPSLGVTDDSVVDKKTAQYLRTELLSFFNLPEGHDGRKDASFEASHMWTGIMGFSRDDVPWVGPVPDRPNLFISAGYTGHGMPNAWLCGNAVAAMVQGSWVSGGGDSTSVEDPSIARLPKCYLVSPERLSRARQAESVESRDWAEMERGRSDRARRSSTSGFA